LVTKELNLVFGSFLIMEKGNFNPILPRAFLGEFGLPKNFKKEPSNTTLPFKNCFALG